MAEPGVQSKGAPPPNRPPPRRQRNAKPRRGPRTPPATPPGSAEQPSSRALCRKSSETRGRLSCHVKDGPAADGATGSDRTEATAKGRRTCGSRDGGPENAKQVREREPGGRRPRSWAGRRTPDAGSRTPEAGPRTPDPGCRTPDPGCRTPDPRRRRGPARGRARRSLRGTGSVEEPGAEDMAPCRGGRCRVNKGIRATESPSPGGREK